jgi:hypothetical protein
VIVSPPVEVMVISGAVSATVSGSIGRLSILSKVTSTQPRPFRSATPIVCPSTGSARCCDGWSTEKTCVAAALVWPAVSAYEPALNVAV